MQDSGHVPILNATGIIRAPEQAPERAAAMRPVFLVGLSFRAIWQGHLAKGNRSFHVNRFARVTGDLVLSAAGGFPLMRMRGVVLDFRWKAVETAVLRAWNGPKSHSQFIEIASGEFFANGMISPFWNTFSSK